ncbi:MAG: hypothetical protein PUF79_04925 [Lactobacillaceae bacterium]|nr:hypothetical protein [Lactobacillaceae bacterium]
MAVKLRKVGHSNTLTVSPDIKITGGEKTFLPPKTGKNMIIKRI